MTSHSQQEVECPPESVVFRNDIAYLINSEEPFSGMTFENKEYGLAEKMSYKYGKRYGLYAMNYHNGQHNFMNNYKDGNGEGLQEKNHKNVQPLKGILITQGKPIGPYYPTDTLEQYYLLNDLTSNV